MTQDEGTTEQFQGDDEGTGAPPLNQVECGIVQGLLPTAAGMNPSLCHNKVLTSRNTPLPCCLNRPEREGGDALKICNVAGHETGMGEERCGGNRTIGSLDAIGAAEVSRQASQA